MTEEQAAIIYAVEFNHLVKIDAKAGTGKTFTLSSIASRILENTQYGIYLAYNKAIVEEAKQQFPFNVNCRTVHSIAYEYVQSIRNSKINISTIIPQDFVKGSLGITKNLSYEEKTELVDIIEEFFLSPYLSLSEMNISKKHENILTNLLIEMEEEKRDVTFGFLLKRFHWMLAKNERDITATTLLMLDEAGDTSGVILEIFRLFPATKKVMAGDKDQNIYTFAHTINGFEHLKNEGITLPLTKSFRVEKSIASKVQKFCRAYLDSNFVYTGNTYTDTNNIQSKAYISRTNAGLIARMIDLHSKGIKFSLTRSYKEIFKLVLILMNIHKKGEIYDRQYAYLKTLYTEYIEEVVNRESNPPSFFSLLSTSQYSENDPGLASSIALITKFGTKTIYEIYKVASDTKNYSRDIVLTTAHSCKGLQFDEVYIEESMNTAASKAKEILEITIDEIKDQKSKKQIIDEAITELRLYYVACTRAKKSLLNAKEL